MNDHDAPPLMSHRSPSQECRRMSFQEAMELVRLPDAPLTTEKPQQKFMSCQPAWRPGKELPLSNVGLGRLRISRGAYGGAVYCLASLAAARAVEGEGNADGNTKEDVLVIHSIQGVFTNPGFVDRPFIFHVSKVHSSRAFSTYQVNACQSTKPSSKPEGPFPLSDASAASGDVCFSGLVTFKRPSPSPVDVQDLPPQQRFNEILSSREPAEWPECPQADINIVTESLPDVGPGSFPVLEMRKVDMTGFNAHKPLPERRELIWYRLLEPLPKGDVNAHIACHAFEADRNGLYMLSNHLGFGYSLGATATLSYSFYVHVNAEQAIMQGEEWWLQEVHWPRYTAGRGSMMSLTWSPEGRHVATGYQDGIIFPSSEARRERGKL